MNQRVRLTRQLLRDAMLRLLQDDSVNKVSVVALCREAGINRSTFYRYYAEPADVLQDIEQNILRDIQRLMDRIDPNNESTYIRQMDEVYSYLYRNARDIRQLLSNMDFGLQLLESTMQKSGLMKRQAERMDETSRQMAANFMLHGGYSVIRQWLMADEPMPPREFAVRVRNILRSM